MHEEAHHNHTGWCIPFAVTNNGATPYHDSMSTTFATSDQMKKKSTTTASLVDMVPD